MTNTISNSLKVSELFVQFKEQLQMIQDDSISQIQLKS